MPEVERYFTLAPEIVVLAGFDGYWKRANPAVEALLGYTEQDWRSRPFREFVHPDDREGSEEEARRVMGGGTVRAFENRMLCKDGSHKWIEWTATPLPEMGVIYAVGRDVTERRRSEAEQAALQRIATLVAQEAPQADVFDAIAEEIGGLLGAEEVRMLRFDSDDSAVVVGTSGSPDAFALGSRLQLEGDSVAFRVLRTGRPARFDDYRVAAGPNAEAARSIGVRAVVGVPVFVERRLWGAISAGSTHDAPLPPDAEGRLNEFTKLMAAAIANAESRGEVERLAEEQAALRRVATLVAESTAPMDLFAAVAEEAAVVVGVSSCTVSRFLPDGSSVVMASHNDAGFPVGSRWRTDESNLSAAILEAASPARVDQKMLSGPIAEASRISGVRSAVGAPIVVEGSVWGMVAVGRQHSDEPLPPQTETRLAAFTELIATAIANAESRDELTLLADEQAALRHVATLVARDAPSTEVFEAVATEVAKLLGTDITVLGRYDDDGAATAIGSWSASPVGVPVGTRSPIGGHNVLTLVSETGKPARVDGYDDASGEAADIARRFGWTSSIAAPVIVQGRLWGVMLVATQGPEPFPTGAENRLAAFTDLVATAVANAESREALAELVDEQTTLRRIATLVAQGASPQELFDAVAEEVGRLLPAANVSIGRYETDDSVTAMASWSSAGPAYGGRWPIKGTNVAWMVLQTGRPARIDDFSAATDPIGVAVREAGYKSAVGSPIVVESRLWGVISAASTDGPMPRDTETRLASFTELVATAVANAESSAALAASRRRIVTASDETRRRIERDLHDGTQQRLVSLGLAVRAAEANLPPDQDDLRDELSRVAMGLANAVEDLQEISRGIHPAILSKGGLASALEGLAHRSPIPVNLELKADARLPEPIEVAAYYVASEALANVAKHAQASQIEVSLASRDGSLVLSVRDDGVGGAYPGGGSGLVGLQDRVEALGGTIKIDSSAGSGTCVLVTLPIATEPDREVENVISPPQELGSATSPA